MRTGTSDTTPHQREIATWSPTDRQTLHQQPSPARAMLGYTSASSIEKAPPLTSGDLPVTAGAAVLDALVYPPRRRAKQHPRRRTDQDKHRYVGESAGGKDDDG